MCAGRWARVKGPLSRLQASQRRGLKRRLGVGGFAAKPLGNGALQRATAVAAAANRAIECGDYSCRIAGQNAGELSPLVGVINRLMAEVERRTAALTRQQESFRLDLSERRRAQDWFERVIEAAPSASIVVDEGPALHWSTKRPSACSVIGEKNCSGAASIACCRKATATPPKWRSTSRGARPPRQAPVAS